jgi:hypothetical protein
MHKRLLTKKINTTNYAIWSTAKNEVSTFLSRAFSGECTGYHSALLKRFTIELGDEIDCVPKLLELCKTRVPVNVEGESSPSCALLQRNKHVRTRMCRRSPRGAYSDATLLGAIVSPCPQPPRTGTHVQDLCS